MRVSKRERVTVKEKSIQLNLLLCIKPATAAAKRPHNDGAF